jgi:hypothetical protein
VIQAGKPERKLLLHELFVTFALKRPPPTGTDEHGNVVPLDNFHENQVRKTLIELSNRLRVTVSEGDQEHITNSLLSKLKKHFARNNSNDCGVKNCCCVRAAISCSKRNAFPRLKLLCSTALAYIDIVSDLFVFIAIIALVGDFKSRRHWIYWSLLYFLAPAVLHSYYIVYCEGWKDRSLVLRVKDAIINILMLRPIMELIKSCRVSIQLEEDHLDDDDMDLQYAMNITDDFKSESFIIYKTLELATESLPQIFLQVVVLAKVWDDWYISSNLDSSIDSGQCGNQLVFIVSLVVSGIQVGVTLQDTLERDVPYGVFPSIISIGMRQPNCGKWLWQLVAALYYASGIFLRLGTWLPFCVVFGFTNGYVLPYIVIFLVRFVLISVLLAECKLNGIARVRGLNANLAKYAIDKGVRDSASHDLPLQSGHGEGGGRGDIGAAEKDDKDDLVVVGDDPVTSSKSMGRVRPSARTSKGKMQRKGRSRKRLRKAGRKKSEISCKCDDFNALVAESMPWVLLSIFVDLPLSMKWLRGTDSVSRSDNYAHSSRFFVITNLISLVENIFMALMAMRFSELELLTCEKVKPTRAKTLYAMAVRCTEGLATDEANVTKTFYECQSRSAKIHSELFYTFINSEEVRSSYLTGFLVLVFVRIFVSVVLYTLTWSRKYCVPKKSTKARRSSQEMMDLQNIGRKASKSTDAVEIVQKSFSHNKPTHQRSRRDNKRAANLAPPSY